ncbi:MAG TPA: ABC transporter substrate-binding protein [Kofleriaceae bacterium]|nr:ABC transporter substrate-binding protein [Kofleriaceae bacterium]
MKTAVAFTVLALFVAAPAQAGVTLSFACDSTGKGYDICKAGAEAWAAKTGNTVNVIQVPNETGDRLALYQQQLAAGSSDVDIYMIDVVWPGLIGSHLLDLTNLVPAKEVSAHFPAIVQNNTFNGKLVGLPWYTDAGVLYSRTDLLAKYGFKAPPKTWDELATMAKKIQDGERAAHPLFQGFVFQGKNYEGLTCNALEWLASFGGGTILDSTGKITIKNPQAVAMLKMVQGWIGTITPEAVTTYTEEEARNVWQAGNSAFMRNWPYAYALGQADASPIKGKITVSALPAGPSGHGASTLGGWQLAVNAKSKHAKEAVDLIRFMTGPDEQKRRAIKGSFTPTIASLYKDPEILAATPFFGPLYDVFVNAVARPATVTKAKYNQASTAFANAVYSVLTKKQTPDEAVNALAAQLARVKGRGW